MKQHINSTGQGFTYFMTGLRRLPEPGIRAYILVPLLVNIFVFAGLIWLAIQKFTDILNQMMGWLPEWLSFLSFLIWPLFALTLLIGMFFTFTIVANLIAAPFNGFLAEKIQRELDPDCVPDGGWKELLELIPRSLLRELQKLWYYLPRAVGLLVISLIPGVNIISPVLWALFSSWMMGIQYCDYAADNEQVNFRAMKDHLARPRLQTMAFGGSVALFTMIPFINLIIMPAAVIGGAYLWVDRRKNPYQ